MPAKSCEHTAVMPEMLVASFVWGVLVCAAQECEEAPMLQMSERSWAPLGATGPSLQIEAEDNPTMVAEGGGQGPHIHTLHAEHYLLQNQGSFSFWHLPGLNAIASKRLVNFQIFAHYSGHNSYLKGLLVNWDNQGEQPGALEMTSEDCRWRAQTAGHGWHDVDGPEHLSAFLAVGQDQGHLRVEMLMPQTEGSEGFKNGFKKVAHLYTMCKPGHHINVKIIMFSQEHVSLVQGQLGRHSAAKATVATVVSGTAGQRWRRDQEFLMNKSWMELGGTFGASAYLKQVNEDPDAFLKSCSKEEETEARRTCSKFLGQPPPDPKEISFQEHFAPYFAQSFETVFQDCIFDVCLGGGEIPAELAGEYLRTPFCDRTLKR
jgi:hypothetical protein